MSTDWEKYVIENLELPNGYIDMKMILKLPYPFIVVVGPRGTGKTVGIYKAMYEEGMGYLSVRRKEKQYKLTANPITTPLHKPYNMLGVKFSIETIEQGLSGVFEEGKDAPMGLLTYAANIADMRGINADEVQVMLYDEGVAEEGAITRSGEGVAILHAYETINRNRELEGYPPMKFILLCNYDTAGADIFVQLRIVSDLYRLKPRTAKAFDKRGLFILNTGKTSISEKKEKTALYNLVGDSEFKRMAIDNITPTRFNECKHIPLKELEFRFAYGELMIYWWKRGKKYFIKGKGKEQHGQTFYDGTKYGTSLVRLKEREFVYDFAFGQVIYENELLEVVLKNYMKL